MMETPDVGARLEAIESSIASAGLLTSSAGFDNGELLLLSAIDNPQRTKKSTANLCQSLLVENPNAIPLLIGLDGDATPVTAQYRVPPYHGRVIPQPHRTVSVGVDPTLLGEEPTTQLIVYVAQFLKGYAPSSFSLVNSPAAVVVPNVVSLTAAAAPAQGPNVAAASVLLQAKPANAAAVLYGTAAFTNQAADTGVIGSLAAGSSVSLEIANLDLLWFASTAAAVVYATAFR